MPRITKRLVDAAEPSPEGRFVMWDDRLTGFGLLVLPSGVKSYVFDYRTAEGRKRRRTVGKHGLWTPDQARATAKEWEEIVRKGGDPLEDKRERRAALTVGDLLDRYLASAKFATKASSTRTLDRSRIARHLKPLLGRVYLGRLTTDAVRRAHGDIRDGKTATVEKTGPRGKAVVRGGEAAARDCVTLLKAVLAWGVAEGLASANPAAAVKVGTHRKRETYLEDGDGYARLFTALDRLEAEHRLRRPVADCVRVIALTGARKSEIAALRWRNVDLAAGKITLSPEGHKSGRATGKPRVIYLPDAAAETVKRQERGLPDALVFPSTVPGAVIDLRKPWRLIRAEAGLPEGFGLHGLRHSLASHMALSGAQAAELMHTMGHSQLSTVQRYLHAADDARRALANRAATVATTAMRRAATQSADVVPLPRLSKTGHERT